MPNYIDINLNGLTKKRKAQLHRFSENDLMSKTKIFNTLRLLLHLMRCARDLKSYPLVQSTQPPTHQQLATTFLGDELYSVKCV